MTPSFLLVVAVFALCWGTSRLIARRGGVENLPGNWLAVLLAIVAGVRSVYEDDLPFDRWSREAIWLAALMLPYLALQLWYSRGRQRKSTEDVNAGSSSD